MARISGVDLPRNKRVEIGLTYVFGIGNTSANQIIKAAQMRADEISKANDKLLRENGLASSTPDIYNFWERYNRCFSATFKTNDGKSKIPSNLKQHFEYFLGWQ